MSSVTTTREISLGKVAIVLIVVAGFVTAIILLRNRLNKNCSSGDKYDETLQKCIKDCSTTPFMKYESSSDTCVPDCADHQSLCGDQGCYSNNMKCIDNKYLCKTTENGCGGECFNPDKQKCVGDKIFENNKVCGDPSRPGVKTCGKDQHCSFANDACIDWPDDQVICGAANNKCGKGEYCGVDGNCTKCDPTSQTVCRNTCCKKGTQQCSVDGGCVDCDEPLCGGKTCCHGKACMPDGSCCDKAKAYNNNTQCCANDLCNGECCPPGQTCQNGKCMTQCGDIYCDGKDQTCVEPTVDGVKKYYCITKGCEWSHLDYTPGDIQVGPNKFLRVCQRDGTGGHEPTYFLAQQPDMSTLRRNAQDEVSTTTHAPCGSNDCVARMAEDGIQVVNFDNIKKTCLGTFNCMKVLPATLETCPFTNQKQCCKDMTTNKFTGQFCKDDTKNGDNYGCYENTCAYGYVCNGDGTCSVNTDPQTNKRRYDSKASCERVCSPESIDKNRIFTETKGTNMGFLGCSSMYGASVTACTNRATNRQDLDQRYNWTCSAEGGTDPVRADDQCNIFCDCHGTIIDRSMY